MISSRPAEAEGRAVPGHWEGDLIIGLDSSAIGTLVDRSSRFTMLVHLPREVGYGLIPREKNGPAQAGYGAITMANAHKKKPRPRCLPSCADPNSPRQRGTNENTNGLLRQYSPKGTNQSRWSEQEIQAMARTLNNRPRKTLDWKTLAETLNEYLKSVRQPGVATTG